MEPFLDILPVQTNDNLMMEGFGRFNNSWNEKLN
jgi:hypothetical protein